MVQDRSYFADTDSEFEGNLLVRYAKRRKHLVSDCKYGEYFDKMQGYWWPLFLFQKKTSFLLQASQKLSVHLLRMSGSTHPPSDIRFF